MFSWLLPKEVKFFDYFCLHAALAKEAAQEALNGPNTERIRQIERQADLNTRECIEMLHKTFITPIDRSDIFSLIYRLDDIIDSIYAASCRYADYKISTPTSNFKQLCSIIIESVQEIEIAVHGLGDPKQAEKVIQKCANIYKLENDAEQFLSSVLGTLFEQEKDLRQLIMWKEIYDHLGMAIQCCKRVASTIEGIILEYS